MPGASPGVSLIDLALRSNTPAARGDQAARRTGPTSRAPARTAGVAPRRRWPGPDRGSTKMCRWLNAPIRRMCSDSSMPLPNTSPDISPTPITEKGWLWVSTPISRKLPLDRFPGAAGGDAHLLVVVAGRPARREGVVEPEPVVLADRVGDVREGRGALVGGDHQIGIVPVVAQARPGDGPASARRRPPPPGCQVTSRRPRIMVL